MIVDDVEKDIPRFVRRCWQEYRDATQDVRKAGVESLKMCLGGEHQWRPAELASRRGNNRPFITIDRCSPVVNQVVNEARNNPPGPQAHPVGGQADKDGADILEGLIREYEYRSGSGAPYCKALYYACAGNAGVFELATEYENDHSLEQRLVLKEIEDPSMCMVDPNARRDCRQDAMWGGKIRVLSREQLIEDYGPKLKVLDRSFIDRAAGWMQDAAGYRGNAISVNEWTGGNTNKGPYYVCEFYRVKVKRGTLKLYTDHILRGPSDEVPEGVEVQVDDDGKEITRPSSKRVVMKYVVTALDVIGETEWPGTMPPYFWVMGPEIYVEGKLYRLSLVDGALDAQRGLNYTATAAAEVVGSMTKSPWIGWQGQFDIANAQGMNPWESSNTQVWAYLEVKPKFAINPTTGESTLLPAPQRNTWEAPIARLLELATFFAEQIKAATSVFFDPSTQSARDAQSGEAIKALQSQTNVGTINWQDQLRRAVTISYHQAAIILPKIYDGPRVRTIVRPDSNHELVSINQEFPDDTNEQGKKNKRNSIVLGEYSLRATAGPSFQTRTEQAIEALTEVFKIVPQLLAAPGVAAQFLRMVGEGSPQVEQIADSLTQNATGDMTPEQMQAQMGQLIANDKQKTALIQQLQFAIKAKLPDLEARKWIAALNAIAGIREAEIKAGSDQADRDLEALEHLTGMAHDVALAGVGHENAKELQQASADQQAQQAALNAPPDNPSGGAGD